MEADLKENIIEKEVYLSTPQIKVLRSRTSLTLNMAGQRAGKSFLIGFKTGFYISNFPKMKGMIAANTYKQLEQSTMAECKRVWKSIYNLTEFNEKNPTGNYVVNKKPPKHFHQFELFADYNGIISFENGAIVFIASLENYLAHDGKTLGWAELDETKDTREDALKGVILARLSQPGLYYHNETLEYEYIDDIPIKEMHKYSPINPCCINTSPSIGVVKWLTDMFGLEDEEQTIYNKVTNPEEFYHKKDAHKTVVIYSTYWNAHNLVENYIENRLSQLSEGEALKFVFGFPFGRSGASYFRNFNKLEHVASVPFIPDLPVHLTYDFNAVPYMTQIACQVNPNERTKEFELRVFKEYCLASPYNSTKSACEHFIQDFENYKPKPYVYFYGDASGDSRQAGSGDHSQFDTVREMLYEFTSPRSDRVPRRNKGVFNRRDFVDRILERKLQIPYDGEMYTVVLKIDPDCKKVIEDFQWLKEGVDGKLKEKVRDPETGASYEKIGHCFVGDTLVETINGSVKIKNIKVGDLVLTRNGYRRVTKVFNNGIKEVCEYSFNGNKITCTSDHHFYTKNKGFIKAQDVVHKDILCILASWKIKKSSTGSRSFFIKMSNILRGGLKLMAKDKKQAYIDISGLRIMEKFLKGTTSTIKTAIKRIMILVILSYCLLKSTARDIMMKKELRLLRKIYWRKLFHELYCGTNQKKAENGTGSTLNEHSILSQQIENAKGVKKNLQRHIYQTLIFAHINVKTRINHKKQGTMAGITSQGLVKIAEKRLRSINGQRQGFVEESVLEVSEKIKGRQEVYDIQVENDHEYFANGILVHNCSDAIEYLICELLEDYYS